MAGRLRGGNTGLKLLALLLAVLLWAIVRGEQWAEKVVSARLELRDAPEGLGIVQRPDTNVLLRIQGPKRVLDALVLDEVAVSLAGRQLREGKAMVVLSPAEVVGVPRGLEVVEVTPRSLRLQVEAVVEREVPVQARLEGSPGPGLVVQDVRCEPRVVRIVGPRSEVRGIPLVFTAPVSVQGRTQGFAARADLEPPGRQVRLVKPAPVQVIVDIARRRAG
jgi:YbbR domain-containing protein